MEIKHYTEEDITEFERVMGLFEKQKDLGIVNPTMFTSRPLFFDSSDRFIIAKDSSSQTILGMLQYSKVSLDGKIKEDVSVFSSTNHNLEYSFNGNFAWILLLESFQKRVGVGSKLVSEIKSNSDISGIYAVYNPSSSIAKSFYLANDFVPVNYLFDRNYFTAMLWKRDGFYL